MSRLDRPVVTIENTVLARGVFVSASSDSFHGDVVRGLSWSFNVHRRKKPKAFL